MEDIALFEASLEDFQFFYELKCGKSDIYWQGFTSKPNREKLLHCFKSRLGSINTTPVGSKCIYIIRIRESKDCSVNVGYVQFTVAECAVEIAISIIESMQGKGIGRAASKLALNMALSRCDEVYVRIRDDNVASWTCFQHIGFVKTEEYVKIAYPEAGIVSFRRWNYCPQKS